MTRIAEASRLAPVAPTPMPFEATPIPALVPGFAPRRAQARIAMADAFQATDVTPLVAQRALAGHTWVRNFVRENAVFLARVSQPSVAATALMTVAERERVLPRDLVALAQRYDGPTMRRVLQSAVEGVVVSEHRDAVVEGLMQGLASVVVNQTVRKPVHEALIDALTRRNASIEAAANNGDAAAREELKANDRIIHDLSAATTAKSVPGLDVYSIAPALTRKALMTEYVALDPRAYPFPNITPRTFAQEAVLTELRQSAQPPAAMRTRLETAASSAPTNARDFLELMPD
jgi:hypothetical protein